MNQLFGDARIVSSSATVNGGADTQNGGDGTDYMFGDAVSVSGSATVNGGDDNRMAGTSDFGYIVGDVGDVSGSCNCNWWQ